MTTTAADQSTTTGTYSTSIGALSDALATVGLAVPTRAATPNLAGVVLECQPAGRWSTRNRLLLRAFDFETSMSVAMDAAVVGDPKSMVVNHAELVKLLSAATAGLTKKAAAALPVTITENGGYASLSANGYDLPLTVLAIEDYPALPATPADLVPVSTEDLAAAVSRVAVAALPRSNDGGIPFQSGINIRLEDGAVRLACTDRYRLTVATLPYSVVPTRPDPTLPDGGVTITAALLVKVLKQFPAGAVTLGYDDKSGAEIVSLSAGGVRATLGQITDSFPPYDRLLPAEAAASVIVGRADLLLAVKRATAVLDAKGQKKGSVALEVNSDAVSVRPILANAAGPVASPAIAADVRADSEYEPTAYGFTPGFLADALSNFTTESVALHLNAKPTKPIVLTDPADNFTDSTAYRHLLMPVRLG